MLALLAAVILAWTSPTVNVDGTLITDLAGFNVYENTTSNMTGAIVIATVTNGINPAPNYLDHYQVEIVPASNDIWYAITAIDDGGNESDVSSSLHWIDSTPQAPIAQIMISVTQ